MLRLDDIPVCVHESFYKKNILFFFSGELAKREPSFSASHLCHLISLTTHSPVRLTTPGGRPAQTEEATRAG